MINSVYIKKVVLPVTDCDRLFNCANYDLVQKQCPLKVIFTRVNIGGTEPLQC